MRWFASLRRAAEFSRVRRRGRRAALATLTAFGTAAGGAVPRVGITVSGAVGGAVVRNLVRRRVQGALAALPPAGAGAEVVLVLRPQAAAAPYAALAADVAEAIARVGSPA
jgi:ribonuclease P protein component